MSVAASVSAVASGSSLSKKTRAPSAEAPAKNASKAPLPLTWPAEIEPRGAVGALVDVEGGVGVGGDERLVGAEEDPRAVGGGAGEGGAEGAVAVDLAGDLSLVLPPERS